MTFVGRLAKTVAVTLVLGGSLGGSACGVHAESPLATKAPEATVTATSSPLKAGANGSVDVVFNVAEGYHWNAEFPAKVEVGAATGAAAGALTVPKRTFEQLKQEFDKNATTERSSKVVIPLKLASRGDAMLPLTVTYSVCNARMCLRKNEVVTAALSAK